MCRFTLYLGPPILLSALVTEPDNSLINQSFESRERAEPLNGDGFGVAWYAQEETQEPGLFRSITPAWNNANLRNLARVVRSPCILAHVRAATQVRAVSEANCHPFTHGPYAFMHNGDVGGFSAVRRPLLAELSSAAFETIEGNTDSEHLFALFLDEIGRATGSPGAAEIADALERTLERANGLVAKYAPSEYSYLNLAVSNGRCAVVTRYTNDPDDPGESLHVNSGRRYVCEDGACRMLVPEEGQGAILVSSEALSDDPGWEAVPSNHMLSIDERRSVKRRAL